MFTNLRGLVRAKSLGSESHESVIFVMKNYASNQLGVLESVY